MSDNSSVALYWSAVFTFAGDYLCITFIYIELVICQFKEGEFLIGAHLHILLCGNEPD